LFSKDDTNYEINQHRIAFFSEEDAVSFVRLAVEKGALEVTCKDFAQSPLIRKRNRSNSIFSKRLEANKWASYFEF